MITIVRNAPPPPERETRGRKVGPKTQSEPLRYPWGELDVGDAFDVPITPGPPPPFDRWPEYNRLSASVSARHKKYPDGPRYVVRMMDDFRVRVWRVR